MKNICIISDGYPYGNGNHCVFVRELVAEFAKAGHRCVVICPQIYEGRNRNYLPYHFVDEVGRYKIDVYAPIYMHLSSHPICMAISSYNHAKSVLKILKKENIIPDIVYGHFIYHNGLTAIYISDIFKCKSFIACGENSLRLMKNSYPYRNGLKFHQWKKRINKVNGIISVSSYNLRLLKDNGFIGNNVNTFMIPNGVNTKVFYPRNKYEMRRELNLPLEDFICIFVGSFCARKGNLRVDRALKSCLDVSTIFIGKGESFSPQSNCLFCGSVKHDEIAKYLCASDVFILPTLGEGCCNAILEALACGLPIISSEDKFNDDILDLNYSIKVDPMSEEQILSAVNEIRDPIVYASMKQAALNSCKSFSIENRCEKILNIIVR